MTDRIPFFDFFDRFVPPRELRLMLHDAAVTGGVLNRAERTMELEVETGEALPDAAVEAVRQKILELAPDFEEIIETTAGSTVTSHCGPGTLGVLFIRTK